MPSLETTNFGPVDYSDEQVIEFRYGLPAFEAEKRFLLIEQSASRPMVFLQSLKTPTLTFVTLPAQTVVADYRPICSADDWRSLGLDPANPPVNSEVLCLVVITIGRDSPPTANLMAPILVHAGTRRGVQAVPAESPYSHRHELLVASAEAPCS